MPGETDTNEDRIKKVKAGFRSAGIPEVQVDTVLEIFYRLDQGVARQVAQGTKFQVNTLDKVRKAYSGDTRRQLARAIIFVAELDNLLKGADPAEMLTSQNPERVNYFANLWHMEPDVLKSMLRELINNFLASYRVKLEVVGVTLQRVPPRPRRELVRSQDDIHMLNEMIKEKSYSDTFLGADLPVVNSIIQMLLKSNLEVIAEVVSAGDIFNLRILMIKQAASNADINYEQVIKDAAEEMKGQKRLVEKALKVVEQGPWPMSLIAKGASAIVGLAHVDSDRQRGSEVTHGSGAYPDSKIPPLVKAFSLAEDAKAKFAELTRLGPAAANLVTSDKLQRVYVEVATETRELVTTIYTSLSHKLFGESPAAQKKIAVNLLRKYKTNFGRNDPAVLAIRNYIAKTTRGLKEELSTIMSLGPVNINQIDLQKFIELKMYANYLHALTKEGKKRNVKIPTSLIKMLTADHIGLVQYKSGGVFSSNEKSEAIYQKGKLPWISSGHPNHVTGLIDFFRWYDRVVDPMELVTGRVTVIYLESAIKLAIQSIGTQIKDTTNVKSGWLSAGTHKRAEAGVGIARIVRSP